MNYEERAAFMADLNRAREILTSAKARVHMRAFTDELMAFMGATDALPDELLIALGELALETDRGCILVGAALLDSLVDQLLRAAMLKKSSNVEALLKPGGALGDFMARVTAAYAFGLLTKAERADLELIAQLRNIRAHQVEAILFDAVADQKVRSLKHVPASLSTRPMRSRYIAAVTLMAGTLLRRTRAATHACTPPDEDIQALSAPLSAIVREEPEPSQE